MSSLVKVALLAAAAAMVLLTSPSAFAQGCGDPDGDGNITDIDGVNVLRAAASLSSNCTLPTCDVNGDGSINDVDGVNVLRAAALLSSILNCVGAPINEFLSEVETGDGQPGQLQVGAAPIPGQGAPSTIGEIGGNTAAVAGGSNTVTIPYDVTGQAGAGAAGAEPPVMVIAINQGGSFVVGYFEIPLTALSGIVTLTALFPQGLGEGTFLLCPATFFQGILSQYGAIEQDPVTGGSAVLQVSLSFTPSQDLDLRVTEPNDGEVISSGNRTSEAGGMLNLDSNAECSIDNINNENVTYPQGSNPIPGQYRVAVRFSEQCVGGGAEFTVVLHNAGLVSSIDGSFNPGEAGEERLFQFTFPPPP
jgi:hypothetical protein